MERCIIKFIETNSNPDYISIILTGLFGISLLSITIFAILTSITQEKYGIPLSLFKRYKIFLLFFPLLLLILFIFLNIYFNLNLFFICFEAIIIIGIIIMYSHYLLEPFYNANKFKRHLLKVKINNLKKESKKLYYLDFENKILQELDILLKRKNLSWTYEELKGCYINFIMFNNKYIYSLEFQNKIIDLGFKFFGNDLIDMYSSIDNISLEYFIEYLLQNNMTKYNAKNFYFIFDKLEYLYNDKPEVCYKLFEEFAQYVFRKPIYFKKMVNYLFNDKWTNLDVPYLKVYIKLMLELDNIINLLNLFENNDEVKEKYNYIKDTYNNNNNLNEKYGSNIDEILLSCYILTRKEQENEE